MLVPIRLGVPEVGVGLVLRDGRKIIVLFHSVRTAPESPQEILDDIRHFRTGPCYEGSGGPGCG